MSMTRKPAQPVNRDLADGIVQLGRLAGSVAALRRITELAVATIQGCAGATATAWRAGEVYERAATHPDLSVLLDGQLAREDGPVLEALRTGKTIECPDTLGEQRWPAFAADALVLGVRCSITFVHRLDGVTITLTLIGARPRALQQAADPATALLAAVGGAALANAYRHESDRSRASELKEAIDSGAVIEQAKGLVMRSARCDGAQALVLLEDCARRKGASMAEIAQWVLADQKRAKSLRSPSARS
ncbi:MAG TPA: ANTAR domain-containing protein [Streptosporangiaceae bacterium]|jgi:hypothetical protein|nr:ANTAR domain-containing protein [Streptosporangiaceae bacterium]